MSESGTGSDNLNVQSSEVSNAFPAKFGETIESNPEYKIRTFSFMGSLEEKADGCVLEVAPHGSTTVMRVIGDDVKVQEIVIKGNGWFLELNQDGEVIPYEVGEGVEEIPHLFEHEKGTIGVWIAGKEGMEVLNVTEPPFNPSMEDSVGRDDSTIPQDFWQQYDKLKTKTS